MAKEHTRFWIVISFLIGAVIGSITATYLEEQRWRTGAIEAGVAEMRMLDEYGKTEFFWKAVDDD